jgi:hypothetical protein
VITIEDELFGDVGDDGELGDFDSMELFIEQPVSPTRPQNAKKRIWTAEMRLGR